MGIEMHYSSGIYPEQLLLLAEFHHGINISLLQLMPHMCRAS